jgi:hypothetical protein
MGPLRERPLRAFQTRLVIMALIYFSRREINRLNLGFKGHLGAPCRGLWGAKGPHAPFIPTLYHRENPWDLPAGVVWSAMILHSNQYSSLHGGEN